MKATHLWYAALAVLASFLAAVPTDAHPAPGGSSSLSGHLDDLKDWNPLDRSDIEDLLAYSFDDLLPPAHGQSEGSGLGLVGDEATSQFRPLDGAGQANIHPQSAEAAHQLGAAQGAAEKRPMSFSGGTWPAHHERGGHSNSPAAADPTLGTSLLHLAAHGHRTARNKRPMALGDSPASTGNELAAGKRSNTASARNDEGSEAVRRGPNAAMNKGDRGEAMFGDDQLAADLLYAIRAKIGSNVRFVSAHSFTEDEVKLAMGRAKSVFSLLTNDEGDPKRIFVHDARQGYVIFLSRRVVSNLKEANEWAFTPIAFKAADYYRGVKIRTILGEIFVPKSKAHALDIYDKPLSEALKDSVKPPNAGEARAGSGGALTARRGAGPMMAPASLTFRRQ